MNKLLLFIALLHATNLNAEVSKEYTIKAIKKAANKVGVPSDLLLGICHQESRFQNYWFFTKDDGGKNNHSFGPCGVLYSTAEGLGFKDRGKCTQDNYKLSERIYEHCKLMGPYTNATYAARLVKRLLARYDNNWIETIAAYNLGSVRVCKRGFIFHKGKPIRRCVKGELLNSYYVNHVVDYILNN